MPPIVVSATRIRLQYSPSVVWTNSTSFVANAWCLTPGGSVAPSWLPRPSSCPDSSTPTATPSSARYVDGAPDETYAAWSAALKLPSVRGLVVGRTMLYPVDDDVAKAVDTAVALVR